MPNVENFKEGSMTSVLNVVSITTWPAALSVGKSLLINVNDIESNDMYHTGLSTVMGMAICHHILSLILLTTRYTATRLQTGKNGI